MRWLTVLAIVLGSFTGLNAEDVQKATGEELFQKVVDENVQTIVAATKPESPKPGDNLLEPIAIDNTNLPQMLGKYKSVGNAIPNTESNLQLKKARGICHKDVYEFCPAIGWKQGIGQCLLKNYKSLSNQCREVFTDAVPEFKPCWNDIQDYCSDIEPGDGRIRKCLINKPVSDECKKSEFYNK